MNTKRKKWVHTFRGSHAEQLEATVNEFLAHAELTVKAMSWFSVPTGLGGAEVFAVLYCESAPPGPEET